MITRNSRNPQDSQLTIEQRFEALPGLINSDEGLVRRGRFLTVDMLVGLGESAYHLSILEGRIEDCSRGPQLMRSWRFAVRAKRDAWQRFWEPEPEPGFHDLFAMTKAGWATVEGELQPFMANLQYFKDVLAAPRHLTAEQHA